MLNAKKRCDGVPISTHAMRGRIGRRKKTKSAISLQAELKGLMDHTAYLILNIMWTLVGSVSCCSGFCCRDESLSLASTSRGETDEEKKKKKRSRRRRRRSTGAASVDSAVAMETASSLLNTCF